MMARILATVALMLASTDVWATNTQCDVEEHGSCIQEAGISLLQRKLEVVNSMEAVPEKGSVVMNASEDVADEARAKLVAGTKEGVMPSMTEAVPEKGSVVMNAFEDVEDEARAKLVAGTKEGAMPNMTEAGPVFSAVMISLPVSPPIISRERVQVGDTQHLEDKNIILPGLAPPCRVYGLGVAPASSREHPTFENDMAQRGCDTHAFDCAVKVDDPNVKNASFHFHPWCIGRDTRDNSDALKKTVYVKGHDNTSTGVLKFKSLADTMAELNHTRLDLLKFDIEGFEWSLFNDELLKGMALPSQMSFELHTEGANQRFVPPAGVKGKGFQQVNELFLKLFDMGYRVISKEINYSDDRCAEFVVVNEKLAGM